MESLIYTIIILFLVFLVTTLPLHFAVNLMGGRTNLLKTFIIMFIAAIVNAFVFAYLPYASIISFILLIWIYREAFKLKWLKALLVWVIQLILIILFTFILGFAGIITLSSFSIF